MTVAVTSKGPDVTSEIHQQFGQARFFIVFDTDTGLSTVYENQQNRNDIKDPGDRGAQKLLQMGVDAVITGNIENEDLAILEAGNITVWPRSAGMVKNVMEEFKVAQRASGKDLHSEMYYWT
jgi:predicted Fe-Mo cluster-binding NifX family protein